MTILPANDVLIYSDTLGDNRAADMTVAYPPANLMTDGPDGNPRLRVDVGQTGFFTGKMFRAYHEAVIPKAGPALQIRFTSPIDFILWAQHLDLTQGALRMEVFTGSTPSGTWTDMPEYGVNRMTKIPQPPYISQAGLQIGGSFTGGTPVDLMLVRASAANNSAQNVGADMSERGLPAGTYYIKFSTLTGGVAVNDDAQMIYSILWEERP